MYNVLNILAGLLLLATIASIIFIIVKLIKKQFSKSLLKWPVVLFVLYLVICAVAPEKPIKNNDVQEKEATIETDTKATETEITASAGTTSLEATEKTSVEETTESTPNENVSNEKFLKDVESALEGQVGKDEAIIDVVLENKDLCISVDLSEKDPAPLTLEDLALSRVSSITDAVLELKDYDELWNTITVDFGELGKVENGKDNMKENEYGGRYFSSENFVLK